MLCAMCIVYHKLGCICPLRLSIVLFNITWLIILGNFPTKFWHHYSVTTCLVTCQSLPISYKIYFYQCTFVYSLHKLLHQWQLQNFTRLILYLTSRKFEHSIQPYFYTHIFHTITTFPLKFTNRSLRTNTRHVRVEIIKKATPHSSV